MHLRVQPENDYRHTAIAVLRRRIVDRTALMIPHLPAITPSGLLYAPYSHRVLSKNENERE